MSEISDEEDYKLNTVFVIDEIDHLAKLGSLYSSSYFSSTYRLKAIVRFLKKQKA